MHVNSVVHKARLKYFSVAAGLELTTGRSRLKGTSCGGYSLFAGDVKSTEPQDTPSDIVDIFNYKLMRFDPMHLSEAKNSLSATSFESVLRVQCFSSECKIEHEKERKLIPDGYRSVCRNGWEFIEPIPADFTVFRCEFCDAKLFVRLDHLEKYKRFELENSKHLWCGHNQCKAAYPRPSEQELRKNGLVWHKELWGNGGGWTVVLTRKDDAYYVIDMLHERRNRDYSGMWDGLYTTEDLYHSFRAKQILNAGLYQLQKR